MARPASDKPQSTLSFSVLLAIYAALPALVTFGAESLDSSGLVQVIQASPWAMRNKTWEAKKLQTAWLKLNLQMKTDPGVFPPILRLGFKHNAISENLEFNRDILELW